MPKARAAALRALELDDRLPQAHISALGLLGHRLASRTRALKTTGGKRTGLDLRAGHGRDSLLAGYGRVGPVYERCAFQSAELSRTALSPP
jgi:hypothetical protein